MELKTLLQQVQEYSSQDAAEYFREYHERVADISDPWAERVITWLEEYCSRSGKALRPLLVGVGAAMSQQIPLAEVWQQASVRKLMLAVELNHKRLLMADDVADQDELRHGAPSLHVFIEQELRKMPHYATVSDEVLTHLARSFTEVAGLWLQEMITDILMSLEVTDSERQTINSIFRHHTFDMTATGWFTLLDQNFLSLADADEATFLEGLRLQTGEYTFVSPLLLGAALGEKYQELKPVYTEYGQQAGVLFQITDDIIGLFGDPKETGKPVGNDLREGKKTLLVQYAYQALQGEDRSQLSLLLGKQNISAAEVRWVQSQVKNIGAEDKTRQKAADYLQKAHHSLQGITETNERLLLEHIAQFILHRTQ